MSTLVERSDLYLASYSFPSSTTISISIELAPGTSGMYGYITLHYLLNLSHFSLFFLRSTMTGIVCRALCALDHTCYGKVLALAAKSYCEASVPSVSATGKTRNMTRKLFWCQRQAFQTPFLCDIVP